VFSNYGLLEALRTIQFTYAKGSQITPADVLRQSYDRSVWEQLLPRMFQWRIVPYTDNGPDNSLRNFTFFVPRYELAKWQEPYPVPGGISYQNISKDYRLSDAEMTKEAMNELMQLQAGNTFRFTGHDFTPGDQFGPGPISMPQQLRGNSASFYTITPNAHIEGTLYRHETGTGDAGTFWQTWFYQSYGYLEGAAIHEWALETPDGHGGYLQLSQDAANALFGTGGLELASQDPIHYPNQGSSSYTYNFKVQSGGVTTRFDVFSNWGEGFADFSPHSFLPLKTDSRSDPAWQNDGDMSVDPFTVEQYHLVSVDNQYAHVTITYPSNLQARPRPGATRRFRAHRT
jgi:hypothetical protein